MPRATLSTDGQRELKRLREAVSDAERAYSDQVLLLVETLRRLGREEPGVPVRVLARVCNQPEVFVRMALEGVVQTSILTT